MDGVICLGCSAPCPTTCSRTCFSDFVSLIRSISLGKVSELFRLAQQLVLGNYAVVGCFGKIDVNTASPKGVQRATDLGGGEHNTKKESQSFD